MTDAVDVLNGVIAARDAEIERLRNELAAQYRYRRENLDTVRLGRAVERLVAKDGRFDWCIGTAYDEAGVERP